MRDGRYLECNCCRSCCCRGSIDRQQVQPGVERLRFGAAAIAAIVIAIVGAVVIWLLGLLGITLGGGWFGALVFLIVAAVVLMISDRFVPGMTVKGFTGAIVAAIAIAVVYYILVWLLGLFGIAI